MIVIIRRLFYRDYVGLSIWPFIILKEGHLKHDAVLLNHERIHLRQQLEMLVLPFYLFYVLEWLIRCCMYRDAYKAYQRISFEQEAYRHEKDLEYLSQRRAFSSIKYL